MQQRNRSHPWSKCFLLYVSVVSVVLKCEGNKVVERDSQISLYECVSFYLLFHAFCPLNFIYGKYLFWSFHWEQLMLRKRNFILRLDCTYVCACNAITEYISDRSRSRLRAWISSFSYRVRDLERANAFSAWLARERERERKRDTHREKLLLFLLILNSSESQ